MNLLINQDRPADQMYKLYHVIYEQWTKLTACDMRTALVSHVFEILDPTFTPGSSQEEKELFEAKQTFMSKVFKETLLTDMGRNKVRMHHRTTNAGCLERIFRVHDNSILASHGGQSYSIFKY